MEPGEKSILKQRPRPKSEPVVLGWMWFSMVLNGTVLSVVVILVYICALLNYCDGYILQEDIAMLPDADTRLADARTVAFVSLVFCENVRSYTSRSFDQPVWRNLCGNLEMHKAILLAQVALWAAVLIPGFSEQILELRGLHIGGWGYLVALVGPIGTLVLCELCKIITGFQMKIHQRRLIKASVGDTTQQHTQTKTTSRPLANVAKMVVDSADNVVRKVSGGSGLGDVVRVDSYRKLGDFQPAVQSI
jgi:magnesium-transporting ATPase (P-type)